MILFRPMRVGPLTVGGRIARSATHEGASDAQGTPGQAMRSGFWNIPVPTQRDVVLPDLMLAPLVGFDQGNYRLGYGGGYFDRTLASRDPRPIVIGVGYDFGALETIFPQPHDIPMHAILTERRDTFPAAWRDHAE